MLNCSCEPNYNPNGTITYGGFVNGIYVHFLSYDKLKKKEVREKLVQRYRELYNNIEYKEEENVRS